MQDLRLMERPLERPRHRRHWRERPSAPPRMRATLLELVVAVQDFARSDEEVVQVISHMLESGVVVLCGNFAGHEAEFGH